MIPTNKCFYEYFEKFAVDCGEKQYLFDETRSFSAQEAFDCAVALGNRLHEMGVRQGDKVALRCTRSIDAYLLYLTLEMMGAVALLTDPHQTAEAFLHDTVVEIKADAVITNERANGGITASGNWELLGHGALEIAVPVKKEARKFPVGKDLRAPCTVIFTSGSTGKSKAVMLCQQGLLQHVDDSIAYAWNEPNDVAAVTLAIHHGYGLDFLNAAFSAHYSLFFPKDTAVEYVLECIEKYKITRLNAIPSYLYNMARANQTEKRNVSSFRMAVIGGAPIVRESFVFSEDELGITVYSQYGMSESSMVTRTIPSDSRETRIKSVGRCDRGGACLIVDAQGNELPCGQEGEICMVGVGIMLGYYGDEAATRKVIDEKGRLHSGDLGYMDEEGNVYVSGRIKDIIIRNGVNLVPTRIEAGIRTVAGVEGVVVVGVSDQKYGEAPCAYVALEKGCQMTEEELKAALADRLPKNEIPVYYIIAKQIPLNHIGKPDKPLIKKLFQERVQ